ncbi:anti-sigma factor domain-containing protein [Pararhodobacter sp. CCB-MM2]|uniref:anti-sigma factor n=1 Tax=Pararhodobacter sp. CCB-MM2 TaxID=1786003 RepID=UPI000835F987|nr:anti-sigma factor [Pararhodobacter sp. CCB-MM2]
MSELPESTVPDDEMLAAEYAMGLLEDKEYLAVRARVSRDQGFAAKVAAWEAQLSQMADLDPIAASVAAREDLMERLFPAPRRRLVRQRLGLWQALTGSAIAAALLLTFMVFQPNERATPLQLYAAQIVSREGDFRVVALVDMQSDEVILARTAGAAPGGRILQVWAHGPGEPAQSVGLWPEGDNVRLRLPAEIAAVQGVLTLGVSEEPPGGSPTGRPSGRVFGTVDIPLVQAEL